MKTKLILIIALLSLLSCQSKIDTQPLNGSKWGEISNPSFEKVISSHVENWVSAGGNNAATHFYSNEAIEGTKSLTIHSTSPSHGSWYTKVNLKPWSTYQFTAWIKTDNLVLEKGEGAGFNLVAFEREFIMINEPQYFSGTKAWRKIEIEFETGNQDCMVLECLFNKGGLASGKVWFDDLQLQLLKSEKIEPAISIDINDQKEEMPGYIYGQFIEHLGKCIYGGIWAEMIEDRKFYYAPDDNKSPWKITGDKSALQIDTRNSFVGELSPVLNVNISRQASLEQSNLGLRASIQYKGRIILKSKGIEKVEVILSWGKEPGQQLTSIVEGIGRQYVSFPISFTSPVFHQNATLKINPIGEGKIWIGTISLMPDDNIEGFRADVLDLLKELNSPVYRWPGGNFVSGYDWKDGIGDPDKRPPRKNPAWTGVEHNDVGIHEFMRFCEILETEAYIAVNAGLGGTEEARKQVEYCIGASNTDMGKWRAVNGHNDPWIVKWWSIGNEMYGGWQLGHMSTEQFVKKHNEFAQAMWSVDPDINLVAVGDPGPWDEMVLANCAENMNYISEHFYRQDWHGGGLMTHIRQIPDAIRDRAEIHRKYRKDIPSLEGKDIRICLDEWNYWYGPHIYGELGVRYYMRDALGVAAGINEFSKQSDIIFMANYAQTVNVIGAIKANTTHSVMAATGQALKMYRKYFGTIPVKISGDNRPLDIAATLTADKKHLTISLVNLSWENQSIKVDIPGINNNAAMEVVILESPDDMSYNEPGQPEKVIITEPETVKFNGKLEVGRAEARIYRIAL